MRQVKRESTYETKCDGKEANKKDKIAFNSLRISKFVADLKGE